MSSPSNDLLSQMRVPGVRCSNKSLFCVHPNSLTAYFMDLGNIPACFMIFDLMQGKSISVVKQEPFRHIKGSQPKWIDLHCIELRSRTFLISIIRELEDLMRIFCVVIELKPKGSIALLVKEQDIGVRQITGSTTNIIIDNNDDLYFVEYVWQSEQRQTCFNVVKLSVDSSLRIYHRILADNQIIDNVGCTCAFIFDGRINFFLLGKHQSELVSFELDDNFKIKYCVLFADSHGNNYPGFEPVFRGENLFTYFLHDKVLYYYIFIIEKRVGELWTLDLTSKKWHKYFTLDTHVISVCSKIYMTPEGRLFLHGKCDTENCSERAHLYHFGVYVFWLAKMIFPSVEQLGALLSMTHVQVYYGPKISGKSLVLILKALTAFRASSLADNKIKIFVNSTERRNFFVDELGMPFTSSNVSVSSYDHLVDKTNTDNDIFVEGSPSLTVYQKDIIDKRKGKTIVTIDETIIFPFGSAKRQDKCFSWHQFKSRIAIQDRQPKELLPSTEKRPFYEQSMDAMNQFYGDWFTTSMSKATVLIPASHDLFNNQYLGPTDSDADGFDPRIFEEKERYYKGLKAESDVLLAFEKLQIGGIYISGFKSMEFTKVRKFRKTVLEKAGIGEFEIDAMFIHPQFGIFVFEIKAADSNSYEQPMKKAVEQLDRIKCQMSRIFRTIFHFQDTLPLHCVCCFPNAVIPVNEEIRNYFIIDKNVLNDSVLFKTLLLSTPELQQSESKLNELKKFSAAMAGYRSMDYLSAGHNALAVQRLIDHQIENRTQIGVNSNNEEIFFTSEQLAVLECQKQHQIISGPPGTGKTLILLRKALVAAQTRKEGRVVVIVPNKQLMLKFKLFFEKNSHSIVRFPVCHSDITNVRNLEDDADIFVDEGCIGDFDVAELRKRLHQNGQTIIVLTGSFIPLEIQNVDPWIAQQNISEYQHFSLNNVIRSTEKIFEQWKHMFKHHKIHLGHNIRGSSVERERLNNSTEILKRLVEIISKLFCLLPSSDAATKKISLENLCIITDYERSVPTIQNFLSDHLIPCGSIDEQIEHPSIAAVSLFTKTFSFEWPIVIAVFLTDIDHPATFFLLAATRCVAKFIILERDSMGAMRAIDKVTQSILSPITLPSYPSTLLLHDQLLNVVESFALRNGENDPNVIEHDFYFQCIRWNLFFSDWKYIPELQHCHTLIDFWRFFADRPLYVRVMLRKSLHFCGISEREVRVGNNLMFDHPCDLLKRITAGVWPTEQLNEQWRVLKRLFEAVTGIMRQEEPGFLATETKEMRSVLDRRDLCIYFINTIHYALIFLREQ